MKSRSRVKEVVGRWMPAVTALVLFGVGWIAPAPARAQSNHVDFWGQEIDVGGCEVGTAAQPIGAWSFWYVENPASAKTSVTIVVQGTDGPFATPNKGGTAVLKPNSYAWGRVYFFPTAPGQAKGTLTVLTSDPAYPILIQPLRGTGLNGLDIPDLTGDWQTPNGDMHFRIHQGNEYALLDRSLGGRAFVLADRPTNDTQHAEIQTLMGQFDGQNGLGWWFTGVKDAKSFQNSDPSAIQGGFGFAQDGNDPDTLHLVADDLTGKFILDTYLTRRSPFSGLWRVWNQDGSQILGDMPFYRITAETARQLLPQFGPASGWVGGSVPATGVSWYYGKYSWINGGQMLGYTLNNWNYTNPAQDMFGRYQENNGGTANGAFEISVTGSPDTFYGHYFPDNRDSGREFAWGGSYLGPARP